MMMMMSTKVDRIELLLFVSVYFQGLIGSQGRDSRLETRSCTLNSETMYAVHVHGKTLVACRLIRISNAGTFLRFLILSNLDLSIDDIVNISFRLISTLLIYLFVPISACLRKANFFYLVPTYSRQL
jgi:hypothetical protein